MAADTPNAKDPGNNVGDVLGKSMNENATLGTISAKLDQTNIYLKQIASGSQSSARDAFEEGGHFKKEYDNRNKDSKKKPGVDNTPKKFSDAFKQEIFKGIFGSDNPLKGVMEDFAKNLGVDFKNLQGSLGKQLGQQVANSIKNSPVGAKLTGGIQNAMSGITNKLSGIFGTSGQAVSGAAESAAAAASGAEASVAAAGSQAATGMGQTALASGALTKSMLKAAPALYALNVVSEGLGAAISGLGKLISFYTSQEDRNYKRQQAMLKNRTQRITQDVDTLVRKPFKILEDAAEALYASWENNIRTIGQTQGYNKNDFMSLMSSFAERLRQENLSSVVKGTDIVSALESVLKSGLSGEIAEEFAYQAVKLNAAVPTQDFFDFADTYASVAANAIKDGMSQSEAIAKANASLYDFTNNILYANRELTGGFTTGLKNATSIYEQAVKISQAARTNNASELASSLTAVAAVTGSIAPDLANSLVDAIYNAATGGNASNLVALRSLAGVNASNTEFLKALASDPQKILSTMFENLGSMYSQSPDAFMEKAEGYSELFGISAEAFQRVDFNYLAQQIRDMNANSDSLAENLALLQSGQTTTNAEQEKANQINQYMIDQGLAYMIDNEVAQAIQQHMWDQEIADALMDATYGVELVGSSKDLLASIEHDVADTVFSALTLGIGPAIRSASQTEEAIEEAKKVMADVAQVVLSNPVGSGGSSQVRQVLGNETFLTPNYVEMMGGTPFYESETQKQRKRLLARANELGYGNSIASMFNGSEFWKNFNVLAGYGDYITEFEEKASHSANLGKILHDIRENGQVDFSTQLQGAEAVQKAYDDLDETISSVDDKVSGYNSLLDRLNQDQQILTRTSNYKWRGSVSKFEGSLSSYIASSSYNPDESMKSVASNTGSSAISSSVQSKIDQFLDPESIKKAVSEGVSFEDWKSSAASFGLRDLKELGVTNETLADAYNNAAKEFGQQKLYSENQNEQGFYTEGRQFVGTDWPETMSLFKEETIQSIVDFRDMNVQAISQFRDLNIQSITNLSTYLSTIGFPAISSAIGTAASSINTKLSDVSNDISKYISTFQANTFGDVSTYKVGSFLSDWENTHKSELSNVPIIKTTLSNASADWAKHWAEYSSYYLQHKIYNGGTLKLAQLEKVQDAEKSGKGDVVNALAEYLTKNSWNLEDLKDPTVQTNALLSQILIVLNAIMNQNNAQSTGFTLPDTLSGLAFGITR